MVAGNGIGTVLNLTGGNSIAFSTPTFFPTATTPITLEAWIKPSDIQDKEQVGILGWDDASAPTNGARRILMLRAEPDTGTVKGRKTIYFWGSSCDENPIDELSLDSSWNANEWQHVAVTVTSNGFVTLYKNGNVILSKKSQPGCVLQDVPTNTPIFIGRRHFNQQSFTGLIDNARVYNTALSSEEIMRHYIVENSLSQSIVPVPSSSGGNVLLSSNVKLSSNVRLRGSVQPESQI